MSTAERAREAVREHPFLYEALRSGVVNYTAAAEFLDVGDSDAVAAALRRYADELDGPSPACGSARVRMTSGLERVSERRGVLVVGDTGFVPGDGSLTAILATGDVGPAAAQRVLGRCGVAGVDVTAAAVTDEMLAVVVGRRDGPDALRLVEAVVDAG
ncbi:hypothetical protein SAMN05216226_11437 [Halovenus aranensis]|uniref:Uncharacterized protein n=1 Tax=Halovenus aranensis TaxID=890420 RepID=A0A1G8YCJ5_9EURY|nr:hypothetical protein [Halovenus aranensis]SDK00568.1 hypothetical protein SAMN05216226_11437 [Halovenus aranensis]